MLLAWMYFFCTDDASRVRVSVGQSMFEKE